MASMQQVQRSVRASRSGEVWGASSEPFGEALRTLTGFIHNSTVGVALFDKNMHCKVMNSALATMLELPVNELRGKTMHQVLGRDAEKLEATFQDVRATGKSASSQELTVQFPERALPCRCRVSVYAIKDELGDVQLIAGVFTEVTRSRSLETRLCRLADQLREGFPKYSQFADEELIELSARSLKVVGRSVELLKNSISLRCHVSETRIEWGLLHRRASLSPSHGQLSVVEPAAPSIDCQAEVSAEHETSCRNELTAGGPSPRERQVVQLLADGKSNKEMAAILNLSTRTVEAYRARVMAKLDLHSVAELVRYAVRHHLIQA